jgi:two-component system sensor histidine kinase UhpB
MGMNVVLVRRAFAPLRRLTEVIRTVDPLVPGTRLQSGPAALEVRELATAFNDMLERLEHERRESARRALRAQEAERRRLARELHDELGQSLTGVLIQIDQAIRAPETADLEDARERARESLDDVRRIARGLRPDTLVELGLASALNALATRFTRQSGLAVDRRLDEELPRLGDDVEVVVYRVAQEALTNVARHADARRVTLELRHEGGAVMLTVDDDGRGIPARVGEEARGITGMRERALLVEGGLRVGRRGHEGTLVRLEVPAT